MSRHRVPPFNDPLMRDGKVFAWHEVPNKEMLLYLMNTGRVQPKGAPCVSQCIQTGDGFECAQGGQRVWFGPETTFETVA